MAAEMIRTGMILRHYKGGLYRVLNVGRHTETGEDMVIYRQADGQGNIWVRLLSMFTDEVEVDGEVQTRFTTES